MFNKLFISKRKRLARLWALNLDSVRRKLMEPAPEGKGWDENQALEAEKWYRRYLALIIMDPCSVKHVPNLPIDLFWHQHILDTQAYGKDCDYVLGYFLHHYPYFGLKGDAQLRDDSFVVTNELYRRMFGEDCTQMKMGRKPSSPQFRLPEFGRPVTPFAEMQVAGAQSCNHGGSGTGCGQGCGRG